MMKLLNASVIARAVVTTSAFVESHTEAAVVGVDSAELKSVTNLIRSIDITGGTVHTTNET